MQNEPKNIVQLYDFVPPDHLTDSGKLLCQDMVKEFGMTDPSKIRKIIQYCEMFDEKCIVFEDIQENGRYQVVRGEEKIRPQVRQLKNLNDAMIRIERELKAMPRRDSPGKPPNAK